MPVKNWLLFWILSTFDSVFASVTRDARSVSSLNADDDLSKICGRSYYDGDDLQRKARIIGGKVSDPHSVPWAVVVSVCGTLCGGTLIDDRWVVTAAHCFRTLPHILNGNCVAKVQLGSDQFDWHGDGDVTLPDSVIQMTINTIDIILHEGYHKDKNVPIDDVALLKLPKAVTFRPEIAPLCLPSGEEVLTSDTPCFIAGWGITETHGSSKTLLVVEMPLIDTRVCNSHDWYHGRVKFGMFCAGHGAGGQDACQGDSGSALACSVDGRYILAGVVSWGRSCAMPASPSVFTDIQGTYVAWIKEKIAHEGRR